MKKWIGIAALAVLMSVIAWTVLGLDSTWLDDRVDGAIRGMRSDGLTSVVKVATYAGSKLVLIPLALIAALWLLVRYRAVAKASVLIGSLAGTYLLNDALKSLFARPRPPEALRLVEESGYSFPSGHAMVATGFYGFLFYLIWLYFKERNRRGWANATVVFAAVWLLLTGFFRVYLGVHHTTDILSAYAGGAVALILCVMILHRVRRKA